MTGVTPAVMFAGIAPLIISGTLIAQLAEPAILVLYVKCIRDAVLLPTMVAMIYGIGIRSVAQRTAPGVIAFIALSDGHAGTALLATPIVFARRSGRKGFPTGRTAPQRPILIAHRVFVAVVDKIMRAGCFIRINFLTDFTVPTSAIVTNLVYGKILDVAVEAVPLHFPGTGFAFVMKRAVKNAAIIVFASLFRCVCQVANTAEPTSVRTRYNLLIRGIGGIGVIMFCVACRTEPAVIATFADGVRTVT